MNGFMTYSLAPASSAAAIWSSSVSVVTMTTDQRRKFRILAQPLEQFQPIHLGHVPVRQNQVTAVFSVFDQLQGFSSVGRLANLVPEFLQGPGEDHPNRLGIVHNQCFGHHFTCVLRLSEQGDAARRMNAAA